MQYRIRMLSLCSFVLFNLRFVFDDLFHYGAKVLQMLRNSLIQDCVFSNLLNPEQLAEHLRLCLSGGFSNSCSYCRAAFVKPVRC